MLDSLLHRFFAQGSTTAATGDVKATTSAHAGSQVSQETAFTREADVDGWVFLAEDMHATKTRSYADVVAGRT